MSKKHYRKAHTCLNCGFHVEKYFCSNCGQENLELREPFWHFVSHSVGHYFHFDNKFFHTLKPLLTEPGKVTIDYLAGKRARYLPPVSMYIFVSIVYFLIVPAAEMYGKHEENNKEISNPKVLRQIVNLEESVVKVQNSVAAGAKTLGLENQSDKLFKDLSFNKQQEAIDTLKSRFSNDHNSISTNRIQHFEDMHLAFADSTIESYEKTQSKLPESQRDGWLESYKRKKEIKLRQQGGESSLQHQKEQYRSKQYFLLMPLLAFFIMRNFRKNHIFYMDHLIFTIHGMTLFFLLKIIFVPISGFVFKNQGMGANIMEFILLAGIAWYMYKALRAFYKRSRKQTIWKLFTVSLLYGLSLYVTDQLIEFTIRYLGT